MADGHHIYCLWVIVLQSISLVTPSYLGYPRINFAGYFRADVDKVNNNPCYFIPGANIPFIDSNEPRVHGTNEFEWLENKVTSVFLEDGNEAHDDPVIGKDIVGNLKRPYAKLTDLDVDCQLRKSTIYGMKFGIADNTTDSPKEPRFIGDWIPSIISLDLWKCLKCANETELPFNYWQCTSSTTQIENIHWAENEQSPALQQLKKASATANNRLSVRFTLSRYDTDITVGYVMGTIGVPSETDTLNVRGQRMLEPVNNPVDVNYGKGNLCYNQNLSDEMIIQKAPFEIVSNQIRVDFSNSFSFDKNNKLLDIGTLKLGIYSESGKCVQLLPDEIPYLSESWMEFTGGIYTTNISATGEADQLKNSKLVLVQEVDGPGGSSKICAGPFSEPHTLEILLEESPYFIRPLGYALDRLSVGDPPSTKTFYITHYGEPAKDITVKVEQFFHTCDGGGCQLPFEPSDAVQPHLYESKVDPTNGQVSFDFSITKPFSTSRHYLESHNCTEDDNATTLPIEGNVYFFKYAMCPTESKCFPFDDTYSLVFLAFNDVTYPEKVNWVEHVGPILSQYAQIAPVMKSILDMSDYWDVIKPHNKQLLKIALSRPFTHAGYMPTTRDLSPVKQSMILRWLELDPPPYDSADSSPVEISKNCTPPNQLMEYYSSQYVPPYDPARCNADILSFVDHPSVHEEHYSSIKQSVNDISMIIGRPLFGLLLSEDPANENCTLDNLKSQLQTAIALEFSTLPPYLTSLYSIIDGCNEEIYHLIHSVVMQEMLHFTQAANTLIAMNGKPVIDSPEFVPSYPTQLPGNVLPGLNVTIKKLTLEHLREVFMGIEVPEHTDVAGHFDEDELTIGGFYEEIKKCIHELDEKGENLFENPSVELQVQWPWKAVEVGHVIPVTDVESAIKGIDMIIHQGEGVGLDNPQTATKRHQLAHFFKFEEISCLKKLQKINETHYKYSNEHPIPFDSNGVWPMRNSPTANDIKRDTDCYFETKAFHQVFRSLLRSLQSIFNGDDSLENVRMAVQIMESLQVHAKRTMWTKFNDDEIYGETCGPVWDYDWPEL